MRLGPDVWGPAGWKFLHFIALAYPENPTEEDKYKYKTFFTLLQDVLPCSLCREHYKQNLVKHPLDDDSLLTTDSLLHWTIDMHNEVNISNNKKSLSYEEAIRNIKTHKYVLEKEKLESEPITKISEQNKKYKLSNKIQNIINKKEDNNNYTIIYGILLLIVVIFILLKYPNKFNILKKI
jgi:hypothetical protein